MAYQIGWTAEANVDLTYLRRNDEVLARRATPRFLSDQPTLESTKRRPMSPNPYGAPWELRLDNVRVLYDIDEDAHVVRILRVAEKRGN
jgi:mRNA-degrading endonuclease RelE of RelBE toxin-antitoxin system